MAALVHTTGIVLSRRDHREADRWYCVYTKEFGKMDLLARGGHKPLAKLTPHLEFPAEVEFLVVRGRQLDTIAGTERRVAYPRAYADYTRLTLLQNALHLVDMGTRPHEIDRVLYDELAHWLAFIDAAPALSAERAGFLLGSFALKLLALLGYRPELHRCLGCRTDIAAGAYRWHALKGGVVCDGCVVEDQETWFAARATKDETLKLVRFALMESFDAQLRPHLPGVVLADFHETVESLIVSHFPTIPAASLRSACLV